jgi:tetrahydromethanopterin S-methyltransferase subunit C
VTFVNAAESVRSTAVYGLGIGLLLAGFLLAGFGDDEDQPDSGEPGSA